MNNSRQALLQQIKDGQFHSGEQLSAELSVSRTAVRKIIKQLQQLGLDIESRHGMGYRLQRPVELLDSDKIFAHLQKRARPLCNGIDVLFETDSTNQYLAARCAHESCSGHVVLAEHQSQGRGRRGNQWLSPLAGGISLSVAWRTDYTYASLGLLSLFVGVAVARALSKIGIHEVGLKWPNDILVHHQKIGGILIEMQGEANGPIAMVIGIGINHAIPTKIAQAIDQPVTDIVSHVQNTVSRNELAAILISELLLLLNGTTEDDHEALLEEWRRYDCYKDRMANLLLHDSEISGQVMGIDDDGCLLISVDGHVERYMSGELSVRLQS